MNAYAHESYDQPAADTELKAQAREKAELFRLLDEGLASMRAGKGRPADEVFSDLEQEFGYV